MGRILIERKNNSMELNICSMSNFEVAAGLKMLLDYMQNDMGVKQETFKLFVEFIIDTPMG
ncbi:hypothetical protein [Anaerofustis sp.]|uniref:hypothetical protein n=1 Tax=Anaerofustis sp. TaxID=1872517 RepID=UPI0025C0CA2A|nr:hypothetical protein [Anaerofustis sp.]